MIKLLNVPGEVDNVEFVLLTHSKFTDFEHEPVSVALGVCVYFHEHVVLILVMEVNRVEVAALEVLVEVQNLLLVDRAGQFCADRLFQVLQDVLGSRICSQARLPVQVLLDQEVDVLSRVLQVLGPVPVVYQVSKHLNVVFKFNGSLSGHRNGSAVLFQLALDLFVPFLGLLFRSLGVLLVFAGELGAVV